jgi:hypothetical protein
MPQVLFDQLPDHGRLWVFPAGRVLDETEAERCLRVVDSFLDQWAAHGVLLRSARELRERQFLLVGVDVDVEAPSGCSIDALVGNLRSLEGELGVPFIDHSSVWFREGDGVRRVSRAEFRALATDGSRTAEDQVFDTTLTRVDQSRDGSFERPASETWHGRAFFKGQVGA